MRKVHFNELKFKNWNSILIIISLVAIIFGSFKIIEFENERTNRLISAVGFLCQVMYFGKMFWYKNYVEWNKLGMNIKLNTFIAKSVVFENITDIKLQNNELIIVQKSTKDKIFKTDNIEINDLKKLTEIINRNSESGRIFEFNK